MTATQSPLFVLPRVTSGHIGLDHILGGGLPAGRTTLVRGASGSGKTVFGIQFLVQRALQGEPGVFVTFEETPRALRENAQSLGFDLSQLVREGLWTDIDVSWDPEIEEEIIGHYDFSGLLARVQHAVVLTGAKRVVIDSFGSVLSRFPDATTARRELLRMSNTLKAMGVTAIITSERLDEHGSVGRHGVEDFVCDAVIILRNELEEKTRRRTVEILKVRGSSHLSGEFPFTILPGEGIVATAPENPDPDFGLTTEPLTSGLPEPDRTRGEDMFRVNKLATRAPIAGTEGRT